MRLTRIMPIVVVALLLILVGCAKSTVPETAPTTPAESPVVTPAPPETIGQEASQGKEIEVKTEIEKTETPTEEEKVTLAAEAVKTIKLKSFKGSPDDLTITVGTTVRWKNEADNFLHIIGWNGYPTKAPKMPGMKPGQSWEYTFNEPGQLTWFSTAHPQTQGKITVKE